MHLHEVVDPYPLLTDGPLVTRVSSSDDSGSDDGMFDSPQGVGHVNRVHDWICYASFVDGLVPRVDQYKHTRC